MALALKTRPPAPVAGRYESDYSRWLFENARLLTEVDSRRRSPRNMLTRATTPPTKPHCPKVPSLRIALTVSRGRWMSTSGPAPTDITAGHWHQTGDQQ